MECTDHILDAVISRNNQAQGIGPEIDQDYNHEDVIEIKPSLDVQEEALRTVISVGNRLEMFELVQTNVDTPQVTRSFSRKSFHNNESENNTCGQSSANTVSDSAGDTSNSSNISSNTSRKVSTSASSTGDSAICIDTEIKKTPCN